MSARDYRITSTEKIVPNFKGSQSKRNKIKMKNYTNQRHLTSFYGVFRPHPVTLYRNYFLVKVDKLSLSLDVT